MLVFSWRLLFGGGEYPSISVHQSTCLISALLFSKDLAFYLKNYHIPYGICEIANGGKLVRIREKPEYEFIVNTGMYVLSPEVIQLIPDDEFFHMTDLIEKVDQFGKKTGVYPIGEDAWIDTGEWDAYHDTIRKFKR